MKTTQPRNTQTNVDYHATCSIRTVSEKKTLPMCIAHLIHNLQIQSRSTRTTKTSNSETEVVQTLLTDVHI